MRSAASPRPSVAITWDGVLHGGAIEAALGDVRHDLRIGEEADRTAGADEVAKLRRRDVESRHGDELEATPTWMPEPLPLFVVPECPSHGNRCADRGERVRSGSDRVRRARRHDQVARRDQVLPAMPGVDLAERVRAEDEAELAPRVRRAERVDRVDRVRRSGARDLAGLDAETGRGAERELEHAEPIGGVRDVAAALVGRVRREDEPDLREAEALAHLLRRAQVPEVHRVEAPSLEADAARVRHPRQRTCPSPCTTYFVVVSSRTPSGPRAWRRFVEMPISAPKPNSPPSVKRVDAFTNTAAASTSRANRRAAARSSVTIASARPVEWRATCAIASPRSATTRTERIRSRYSVSQSRSVAGTTSGTRARVSGQPRSSTPRARIAAAISGRNAAATSRWTSNVSSALQTPGRDVFALSAIASACARSAARST